jgi:glycosyltransferase involved in cell wall biosynthesis
MTPLSLAAVSLTVLHVAQPVDGGVPRVVVDLVEDQVSRGWRVIVACPASGWLADAARAHGAEVVRWEAGRTPGLSTITQARHLARVIRRTQPSLVHLHSSKAGLAGRLAVRGSLPTVFQPHAWSFDAVHGGVGRASKAWERIAVRWTDLVVAVSQDERERGERAGIRATYAVAANGVDVNRFAPRDRDEARRQLGLDTRPTVICVGRLARQKGQDMLLDTWPQIRAQVPDARLVLVGDGPAREGLAARGLDGIDLVGAVIDAAPWYAASDVVVLPSRWEGMALVSLEAMACARSVVSFDVAGARESLLAGDGGSGGSPGDRDGDDLGDAGVVVPTGDVDSLAREVARRLADPELAAAEGDAGRARVVAHFDVRQTSSHLSETLAALVQAG